jgi:hypothetical protein
LPTDFQELSFTSLQAALAGSNMSSRAAFAADMVQI